VLPGFRARAADAELEQVPLGALLERLAPGGLVKAGGKQRTGSAHVVAAVAGLNQLELAGEGVRAAAGALTAAHPGWAAAARHVSGWTRKYGTPVPGWNPPASKNKRDELAVTCANDGYALLRAVHDKAPPAWLAELPAAGTLRKALARNYTLVTPANGREVARRRGKQPEGDPIPPGRYRIASPCDTGARQGARRDESWPGRKLHVTGTRDDAPPCGCAGPGRAGGCDAAAFPNLVTCAAAASAAVTGTEMTGAVGDALAAKGPAPGRHCPGSGCLPAGRLAAEAARHGTALIGPLQAGTPARARAGQGYARADFTAGYDAQRVTCPQGKTSSSWSPCPQYGRDAIVAVFARSDCEPCPARELRAKGKKRTITLQPRAVAEAQAALRAAGNTKSPQAGYARRAGVEETMHPAASRGARRARYRGLRKTRPGHAFTAVALNLPRLNAYRNRNPLDRARTSHLTRLEPNLAA
jgi:hypothetical protein